MGRRGSRSGGFGRSHGFGRSVYKPSGEDNRLRDDEQVNTAPVFNISQPQRQSVQPKSVQPSLKTAQQQQQPRAQLPNLDDINEGIQATQSQKRYRQGQVPSDERRQYVNYQDQYATTGVRNKLKDRYKRGKKSKKGSTVFGTLEGSQSGNSVLDSYRSLGKKFR
jgi:hypothetical protein